MVNPKKRILLFVFLLTFNLFAFAQTGPGGVGQNNGSTSLKIWYRTDFGVSTTGTSIDAITNSAGIAALDISETGTQRPTLVTGVVNGYDEISFSGSNRLRTGLTLTTTNFVNDQASSFVVARADNTTQTSCVYTTDPLVTNRFTNHIPWSNTVYFDIGQCCSNDARIQVGGLTGLNNYSVWSYDALPSTGKQLYRNGALLQSRANTSTYNSHATHRFNIGGNTSGSNGFVGDVTEIIVFNNKINTAQRIIIENYLAAKYGLTLSLNDLYTQDDPANGNYDHDVAGIGRIDASNIHDDAQGSGIVRILNPSGLGDNEFLFWGHDNGIQQAFEVVDVPLPVQARFDRVWRVSEVGDVGDIDIRFDLTGLQSVTASDLRLLIDTDNDGVFSDETPITGATNVSGDVYQFSAVAAIANNLRFTLGTINSIQTPLPITLISFNATKIGNHTVQLDWQTASEMNNDYFTVERSKYGAHWEPVLNVDGAGDSFTLLHYSAIDEKPYPGLSYYRLKQTDFDGQFFYSSLTSINLLSSESNEVSIYPNPSTNKIVLVGSNFELGQISFINSMGQDVTSKIVIEKQSGTEVILDLSDLSSGVYYVRTFSSTRIVYKL